jgi:hypothetical protein
VAFETARADLVRAWSKANYDIQRIGAAVGIDHGVVGEGYRDGKYQGGEKFGWLHGDSSDYEIEYAARNAFVTP